MKVTYAPTFSFIASLLLMVTRDQEWVSLRPAVELDVDASETRAVRVSFTREEQGCRLLVMIELEAHQTLVSTHRFAPANRVSLKSSITYPSCTEDLRLAKKIWPHVHAQFARTQTD